MTKVPYTVGNLRKLKKDFDRATLLRRVFRIYDSLYFRILQEHFEMNDYSPFVLRYYLYLILESCRNLPDSDLVIIPDALRNEDFELILNTTKKYINA
jgi:hypothetical protein